MAGSLWLKKADGTIVPVGGGGSGGAGSDGFTYLQETAPVNDGNTTLVAGQTWFDTSTGDTFTYYQDVDSSQWVQDGPGSGSIGSEDLDVAFGVNARKTDGNTAITSTTYGSTTSTYVTGTYVFLAAEDYDRTVAVTAMVVSQNLAGCTVQPRTANFYVGTRFGGQTDFTMNYPWVYNAADGNRETDPVRGASLTSLYEIPANTTLELRLYGHKNASSLTTEALNTNCQISAHVVRKEVPYATLSALGAPEWVDYSEFEPTMAANYTLSSWSCWYNGQSLALQMVYKDDNGRNSSGTGDIGNTTIAVLPPEILALCSNDLQTWPGGYAPAFTSAASGRLAAHTIDASDGDIRRNAISSGDPVAAGASMSLSGTVLWNTSAGGGGSGSGAASSRVLFHGLLEDQGTNDLANGVRLPLTPNGSGFTFFASSSKLYHVRVQVRAMRTIGVGDVAYGGTSNTQVFLATDAAGTVTDNAFSITYTECTQLYATPVHDITIRGDDAFHTVFPALRASFLSPLTALRFYTDGGVDNYWMIEELDAP